jgi:hypothetical protein
MSMSVTLMQAITGFVVIAKIKNVSFITQTMCYYRNG